MAGGNMRSQLLKAVTNIGGVLVKAPRTIDSIANIEMNSKSRAIHCLNEVQISVRTVRQVPAHHFNREFRMLGLHRIDNVAAIFHGGVEKLLRKILRIWAIPNSRVVRAGDIDTAASADGFRQ